MTSVRQRTILKWAGNKTRIVADVLARLPEGKRLVEPFTGSAAVFMHADYPRYQLCDSNPDLIELYTLLKTRGNELIDEARRLFVPENNSQTQYTALRDEFNRCHDDPLRRATLFLYLNRHGYNGLCRYNSKGGFNVPFGRRNSIYFPEEEMRRFTQKVRHASLHRQDFALTMANSGPGDVLYCDPPYLPLTTTAKFTAYAKEDFSLAQQQQLADLAKACTQRGIPVLISNHDTPLARELYQGAELFTLQVQRFISCKGEQRGKANELLALFLPDQQA